MIFSKLDQKGRAAFFIGDAGADIVLHPSDLVMSSKANPYAVTAKAKDRIRPQVWPHVDQRFDIAGNAKIFTIGSCFARNIEDNLSALGYELPTLEFDVPQSEKNGRPATILNKYTPASIYQEVKWTHTILSRDGVVTWDDVEPLAFHDGDGKYLDLALATLVPVDRDRLLERRQHVFEVFKEAFASDAVTLTLGLVEAWYDKKTDLFVQFAPSTRSMRREKDRFYFCQMTYPVCLKYIRETIDLIRSVRESNFLITTSPVVLGRTFTEQDVITANMESKSILRAVCGQIARDYDFVGYFPSFESAILTKDPKVFLDDDVHVAPEFVGSIVSHLVNSYFSNSSEVSRVQQTAVRLKAEGRFEEIAELVWPIALSDDISIDTTCLLAQSLARGRDRERALLAVEHQIRLGGRSAQLYSIYRSLLSSMGRKEEAKLAAEVAIEIEPEAPVYRFDLANILHAVGETEKAIEIYRENLCVADNDWRYVQFSKILDASGKRDEAVQVLGNVDPDRTIPAVRAEFQALMGRFNLGRA